MAGFYIKNNKTWGYYGTLFRDGSFYDDAQFSKATAESTPIINYLTKTFGFTPQKTVRRVASDNLETYKWEKNGKMFSLSVSKGSDVKTGASYSTLSILCLDENFLR